MDPIDTINPKKDSTFAMMLAAARKGWRISVMTLPNLSLRQDQFWARYQTITVRDDPKHYYDVVSDQEGGPEAFDAILMRKDPPFNMDYIYATYLLEFAERAGCRSLTVRGASGIATKNCLPCNFRTVSLT